MDREAAAGQLLGLTWAQAQGRAATFVAEAEADVTRWMWIAGGGALPEQPEPVPAEPWVPLDGEDGDARQLGLDAQGELRLVRYFDDGEVSVEAVRLGAVVLRFLHHDGVVLGQLYHAVHDTGGRLTEFREWNVWGDAATRTEYVWEGERPVFAIKDAFAGALGPADAARSRTRYAYDYDEQGLARIPYKVEDVASGEVLATGLQWIRSSPDAFAAARALVVAELPARILAWATRVAPFEPVAALALIVSADEAELPPRLALGTVAELRAINAQHGGQERHDWHAFSTMGFECWDPEPEELCGDVAFDDACALLVQEWWRVRELDASLELLRDVVRRLQRLDWSEALRPSAIYVTVDDLSDEDALEHVQATVSAEIIDALKALTT